MTELMTRENEVFNHDGWLMYNQEQWEAKNNWLAFTLGAEKPFTRSNGTILARLYERLTKASRRAEGNDDWKEFSRIAQVNYRRGVYDAYQALQDELA